jgi:hypothetical protein
MSSLYERQTVEVGGIPFVEYGDEPDPQDDNSPEPTVEFPPVCGQCVNFHPSRVNLTQGYCPCVISRNEWNEEEQGKSVASSDPACPRFEMDCPF